MIKGRDFVFVGLQSWDIGIGSNCKNIAAEISKHNRVLYVSKPLDRISLIRNYADAKTKARIDVLKGEKPKVEKISDNLWNLYPKTILESINWIGSKSIYRYLNRINNRRLADQIQAALQELNFNNIIVFNDNDFISYHYLKEYLSPQLYIYYIRDNLTSQAYFKKRKELEEGQIKKAHAVATNSEYLRQYATRFNEKSFFVGQGCDIDSFLHLNEKKPDDLHNIPKPIIGYTGLLSSTRLDIALMEYIADQLPASSMVLIGPEDQSFKTSSLHQKDNVFFLGSKKPEEIPSYIKYFDVCINPQVVNDMTIGNYPRKVDEYLIMGKPVIATRTLAMEYFESYTYLCNTPYEYIHKIQQALKEDYPEAQDQRKSFALSHTWTENVANIYQVIEEIQVALKPGHVSSELDYHN